MDDEVLPRDDDLPWSFSDSLQGLSPWGMTLPLARAKISMARGCLLRQAGQNRSRRLGLSSSSSSMSDSVILVSKSSMVYFSCWSPVSSEEWVSTLLVRR